MNSNPVAILTRCAAVFVLLIGCDVQRHDRQDNSQVTNPPADDQPNEGYTKSIGWVLGPFANGDLGFNIVFRERSKSTRSSVEHQPKSVVPRPMIQGAPEGICIGEDGSQYVGGSFSGTRDFGTGPGFDLHKAVGKEDGFVTCFDRNGKYRWTRTFGARQRIDVRGVAVSHGVVYAVCEELDGHVAILAMDSTTGASKPEFGVLGCQMFRCGQRDCAAGIRCQGNTIYVAIRCINFPGGKWPAYSFTIVLAIDRSSGSAVTGFGNGGAQTIGNALASGSVSARVSPFNNVEPFGLATSGSTLYVFGSCEGTSLGIGRQGTIVGGWRYNAFVAALSTKSGTAVGGFGQNGLVVLQGNNTEAADAVVSGGLLYLTGRWQQASHDKAFLAVMDAGTGTLSPRFGKDGIKVFGPWEWESSCSIRVNGQVVYIAGGYIDPPIEGVFVAAFDRSSGLPVMSFGNSGSQLFEGPNFGNQGRIEPFGDSLYLVARTEPLLDDKREIRIGGTTIKYGEVSGFLFRLGKDGAAADK